MEPWVALLPQSSNAAIQPAREFSFRLLYTMVVWHVMQCPVEEQHSLLSTNRLDDPFSVTENESSSAESEGAAVDGAAPVGLKRLSTLSTMLSSASKRRGSVSDEEVRRVAKDEVTRFLAVQWANEPVDTTTLACNSMLWWSRVGEKAFPCVAVTAKRILAVLPSSAESERFASTAGDTLNSKRCLLNPAKAAKLVYLAHAENFSTRALP